MLDLSHRVSTCKVVVYVTRFTIFSIFNAWYRSGWSHNPFYRSDWNIYPIWCYLASYYLDPCCNGI